VPWNPQFLDCGQVSLELSGSGVNKGKILKEN
jgi:hypothetical protein